MPPLPALPPSLPRAVLALLPAAGFPTMSVFFSEVYAPPRRWNVGFPNVYLLI